MWRWPRTIPGNVSTSTSLIEARWISAKLRICCCANSMSSMVRGDTLATSVRISSSDRRELGGLDMTRHAFLLFDDLGVRQQRLRHGQAERFGGPQIDHHLEFGRLGHRHLGRGAAAEDMPGIDAGLSIAVG